jgi:hypothetical protein
MIVSFGKSFAYAFVRSAAGVAAVAAAPYVLRALRRTPVLYNRACVVVADRAVAWGRRVGCAAEARLHDRGE